jgi:hypothetical protein
MATRLGTEGGGVVGVSDAVVSVSVDGCFGVAGTVVNGCGFVVYFAASGVVKVWS